jgi:methyl-accepting chemotaxis protein
MSADRVADEAAKLTNEAKQTGQDAIDQAKQSGQDASKQAQQAGQDAIAQVKDKSQQLADAAGQTADQARESANRAAQDLAKTLRSTADGLSTEKLQEGVDYLRQTDPSQLIGDAQDLARRNQNWLIGIGVVGALLLLWALWSAMRRDPQA